MESPDILKPQTYELPGIPEELAKKEMPLLFSGSKGTETVKKLKNGSMLITGFPKGKAGSDIVHFVYRFNPKTHTAELLYFDAANGLSANPEALVDKIEFDKNLPIREALQVLSAFMGVSSQKAKERFPETNGCNEAVLHRSFASRHPQLNISFRVKGEQPVTRLTYNYLIDTDEVELVYTNNGTNAWRKGEIKN